MTLRLPLLALLLPTSLASAQVPQDDDYRFLDWPGPGTGLGRLVAGDLPGALGRSVVTVHGGSADIAFDPMHAEDVWSLGYPVVDAAFASDGSGVAGSDCLYALDTVGAAQYVYDPEAPGAINGFVRDLTKVPPVPVGSKLIVGGHLDDDGLTDLVVAGPDLLSLHMYLATPSGSWTVLPTIWLSGGGPARKVRELAIVDFEPGAVRNQLAVCSEWGLEVYRQNGTRLYDSRCSNSNNYMSVLRSAGALDRLALVHTEPLTQSHQQLTVAHFGGEEAPIGLFAEGPTNLDVTGISSGDVDGDGLPDLMLAHQTQEDVRILPHRDVPGPSFDLGNLWLLSTDTDELPITLNRSQPLLEDLDRDGAADLFQVLGDQGNALAASGAEAADLESVTPPLSGAHPVFVSGHFWITSNPDIEQGNACQLDLYVRDHASWGWTTDYNDIEVLVWYQEQPTPSSPQENSREAFTVGHYIFEDIAFDTAIVANEVEYITCKLSIRFGEETYGGETVDGNFIGSGAVDWTNCYFLQVRLVNWDNGAVVPPARTSYLIAGTAGEDGHSGDLGTYLLGRSGAWQTAIPCGTDDGGSGGGGSSGAPLITGGLVPQTRIPPVPPAETPIIQPAETVTGAGVGGGV